MKKHILINENTGSGRPQPWQRLIRISLCILLAVIACAGCALGGLRLFHPAQWGEGDKIRIYIDQGHNPAPHHNSGALGNGIAEEDLTYEIGILLAERLTADERFAVCLSRPTKDTVLGTDNSSSLQARVEGAKRFAADYLISLHINSFTEDTANGIEVFTAAPDGEAFDLGSALLQGMVDATGLRDRGMKQSTQLYLLQHASMPAVLLEMGFLSHSGDAALLAEHPEQLADGIYNGIADYFGAAHAPYDTILLWTLGVSATLAVALILAGIVRAQRSRRNMQEKTS